MKNLLILIFLITLPLISQDNEPTPWNFVWGHSSTPRPFVLDSFEQESMFTGFQWGGSWQMNNALLNNFAELGNLNPSAYRFPNHSSSSSLHSFFLPRALLWRLRWALLHAHHSLSKFLELVHHFFAHRIL